MTEKQLSLYKTLRRRLMSRNIKKIPTCSKVQDLDNQRSFMILKVFTEELKNLDVWETSHTFRDVCFTKYGYNFNIFQKVQEEILEVLEYAGFV